MVLINILPVIIFLLALNCCINSSQYIASTNKLFCLMDVSLHWTGSLTFYIWQKCDGWGILHIAWQKNTGKTAIIRCRYFFVRRSWFVKKIWTSYLNRSPNPIILNSNATYCTATFYNWGIICVIVTIAFMCPMWIHHAFFGSTSLPLKHGIRKTLPNQANTKGRLLHHFEGSHSQLLFWSVWSRALFVILNLI